MLVVWTMDRVGRVASSISSSKGFGVCMAKLYSIHYIPLTGLPIEDLLGVPVDLGPHVQGDVVSRDA